MKTSEKLALMEEAMSVSWKEIDDLFSGSTGYRTYSRDAWAMKWAEAKFPIFQKLGNKLKISREVESGISDSDVRESFEIYVSRTIEKYESISERDKAATSLFFSTISTEEIKGNRFTENKVFMGDKINSGAKISRYLKKVILDKELLDKVQVGLSRFNESLQVRGVLELSIDPIDILSMSLNRTRRWTSCHDIFSGCYGAGPISYLLDESTFISQILLPSKQESRYEYQNIIPDKIWRRMGMFSEDLDLILLSRSYPSSNKSNTETFYSMLEDTFGDDVKYGLVDGRQASSLIRDRSRIHYNDITEGALSKVPVISLNAKEHGITEENMKENTIRPLFERLIENRERAFVVGVDYVQSPTLDFNIYEDISEGGVFEENDSYYEDSDDDYY